MRTRVEWVEYRDLSETQKASVRARYRPPYAYGYLYRIYLGQLTQTGNDRRRV